LSGNGQVLGIDLGGTQILAARVDASGRIRERSERPTPAER
jgi:predicted NBD/HSP70 family sugar kinase